MLQVSINLKCLTIKSSLLLFMASEVDVLGFISELFAFLLENSARGRIRGRMKRHMVIIVLIKA